MSNKNIELIKGALIELLIIQCKYLGPGITYLKIKMLRFRIWHKDYGWSYEEMQEAIDELIKEDKAKIINRLAESLDDETFVVEITRVY